MLARHAGWAEQMKKTPALLPGIGRALRRG
jgi:hypothetical protein